MASLNVYLSVCPSERRQARGDRQDNANQNGGAGLTATSNSWQGDPGLDTLSPLESPIGVSCEEEAGNVGMVYSKCPLMGSYPSRSLELRRGGAQADRLASWSQLGLFPVRHGPHAGNPAVLCLTLTEPLLSSKPVTQTSSLKKKRKQGLSALNSHLTGPVSKQPVGCSSFKLALPLSLGDRVSSPTTRKTGLPCSAWRGPAGVLCCHILILTLGKSAALPESAVVR